MSNEYCSWELEKTFLVDDEGQDERKREQKKNKVKEKKVQPKQKDSKKNFKEQKEYRWVENS